MSFESEAVYFVEKTDQQAAQQSLSIFYVPHGNGLAVPREVLRAEGATGIASGALWKLITGDLSRGDDDQNGHSNLMPSTIETVRSELDEFLRTRPADDLIVDDDAPEEVKAALNSVQDALANESQQMLADMLGLVVPDEGMMAEVDDRPYPGQYL